jgi:hypothetical protein
MTKLLAGAVALALSLALAGCSKSVDAGSGGSAPPPTSSSAPSRSLTAFPSTPTDAMSSGTTDDTGASGTSTATAAPVDQTTPEAAMTSWFGAMVAGDGATVCKLMASKGKAIDSIPGAAATCGKAITPQLDQIKQLGAAFQGLTIKGATVTGDSASFESVTTEPALAADVVSSFKAVRLGGKWYVTQG